MLAGNEAMMCGVHPDAKKLIPWFSICHVGLQFTGLPTHVLSHRSEVSQCTKHMSGPGTQQSRFTLSWDISEGLVVLSGR